MQSVLVLHCDPKLEPILARVSSPEFSFRDFSLVEFKSEERLNQLLPPQVLVSDAVLVDLPSLQILGKWVLAWLRTHQPTLPVIVRADSTAALAADLMPHWTYVYQSDPIERVRQIVSTYLTHHRLQRELRSLKESITRHPPSPAPMAVSRPLVTAENPHSQRESLRSLARLLSHGNDLKGLVDQALFLLRDMFGVGKVALFLREQEPDLISRGPSALTQGSLVYEGSVGMPRDILRSLPLSLHSGIGRMVATGARIVRRDAASLAWQQAIDTQCEKEFEVLGTDFAVPILDGETTLGMVTFGGKITGEPFANDELELVFHLMNQCGLMLRNVWLHQEVEGQRSFMLDVLAHAQNGVLVLSARGKIAALNRRAAELFGIDEKGLIGADANWLPSQVSDLLFETLRTGQPHKQREVRIHKTGLTLSISTARFPSLAEGGRADTKAFAVASIEDMTQIKAQHARAREVEQQEFVLTLASRLSHELKNSLVSISTFAQLLPQQYDSKEFRDEFFKIVSHEVSRVDMLVEHLNFFAQPLLLRLSENDLGELCDGVIARLVEEFKRQRGGADVTTTQGQPTILSAAGQPITINKRYAHTARKIECDPKRLELALHNIVFNALQSMPGGGRLSLVTDDAKANGHAEPRIEISVIDTGEGIPLANLEAVFQPFFTTRNVGVGLGLTISQKVIERHGGHISVESKLGKGSTFKVIVPVKAVASDEDVSPLSEAAGTAPPAVSPRKASRAAESSPRRAS